jgi:hypothetical protein
VVGVVAYVLDARARDKELDALSACLRSGHAAVVAASGRMGVMSQYVAPALATDTSPAVATGMQALVQSAAAEAAPRIAVAQNRCGDMHVLRCHGDLRRARSEYTAYLAAWSAYVGAVATDPTELGRSQDQLTRWLAQVRSSVRAASPVTARERAALELLRDPQS